MNNEFHDPNEDPGEPGLISRGFETLTQLGLGEWILRAGTSTLTILFIAAVIWLVRIFYAQGRVDRGVANALQTAPTPAAVRIENVPQADQISLNGIPRQALVHTNIPSRPRSDITKYTVVEGDTVIGIADKFGLQPKTIFSANYYTLLDDPHNLQPGMELNILPVDGVYREWQEGEGLNGVAKFYGVKPEDIVNYPPNHLDAATIGDYAHPNIKPGTWIIVPGGLYQYHSAGNIPLGITRTDPASAQVLGPGFCQPVTGGAVGTGTFIWPANKHYLSGFNYSEKTNHLGIDIAGSLGEGVYATDGGVIVYAGWNNYGYGNMIMIDHGTGFQSLYAHLSEIYVGCGQSVSQGAAIGAIGSTGHSSGAHLHFEVRTLSNPINPYDVLPAP